MTSGQGDLATTPRGRVLVLDDDPAVRETIAELLEERFTVRCVDSITAAWNTLAGGTFDVVVSDHDLGDGDRTGAAFLRQVAQRHPEVGRILLTGEVDSPEVAAVAAEARDDGRLLLLLKPVDPVELLSWVGSGAAMAQLARARASFRAGA